MNRYAVMALALGLVVAACCQADDSTAEGPTYFKNELVVKPRLPTLFKSLFPTKAAKKAALPAPAAPPMQTPIRPVSVQIPPGENAVSAPRKRLAPLAVKEQPRSGGALAYLKSLLPAPSVPSLPARKHQAVAAPKQQVVAAPRQQVIAAPRQQVVAPRPQVVAAPKQQVVAVAEHDAPGHEAPAAPYRRVFDARGLTSKFFSNKVVNLAPPRTDAVAPVAANTPVVRKTQLVGHSAPAVVVPQATPQPPPQDHALPHAERAYGGSHRLSWHQFCRWLTYRPLSGSLECHGYGCSTSCEPPLYTYFLGSRYTGRTNGAWNQLGH